MTIYNQISDSITEEIRLDGTKIYHVKEFVPTWFGVLGVNKYKTLEAAKKYTDEKYHKHLISCNRIHCIDCNGWKIAVIAQDDETGKAYIYWYDKPKDFDGDIVLCFDTFNSTYDAYNFVINKYNKNSIETIIEFSWYQSIFEKMKIISQWLLRRY